MEFHITHIEQIDSTNAFLQRLLDAETLNEGYLVTASEQLHGRGYGSNVWQSEAGKNLLFSLFLKPHHIDPADQFIITKIVSLSIVQELDKYLPTDSISVKWPNDIYVGDKKIAGILIQNSLKGSRIDHSIIGVGLNVNQKTFHPELPNPISIFQRKGKTTDVRSLLNDLLLELSNFYELSFSIPYHDQLDELYHNRLYKKDKWVTYREGSEYFQAKITGLGKYGKLKLELKNDQFREIDFKEVEMIV